MARLKYAPDRRARITEAFTELLRTKTYESITTREVAERAGLTTTAIYYYFGSKRDILYAVFDDYAARSAQQVLDAASSLAAEPAQCRTVADFTELLVERWMADPEVQELGPIDVNLMALALRDETIAEHYRRVTEEYDACIEQAMASCGIQPENPKAAARLVTIAITGFIVNRSVFKGELTDAELLGQLRGDE